MKEKILYDDQQLEIAYLPDSGIVYIQSYFHEDTSEQEYKYYMGMIMDILRNLTYIEGVLANSSQSNFVVRVEWQQWLAEQYAAVLLPKKTKKFAVILPESQIANLSIQQVVDEAEVSKPNIDIQFFADVSDGENWLLDKN